MKPTQIIDKLTAQFGNKITEAFPNDKHPRIHVAAENWREIATFLYQDDELAFDWLASLTALDYIVDNEIAAAFDFRSSKHGHWFAVKVIMPREKPTMPTTCDLWPAGNWHEREAFDMMGIIFEGHPDHRRILLPEDWVGYPLRKDYVFPREYHGIPGSYEMDWQQKADYPT